ncbi:putative monooxygenase p33MONOX [Brachyhypopomus gauderio]|uniref:putative monooxygenase p33MONOX n=1 Tax=Brachyhypopomus gauderio TaxID=698409 RepID=UPI00404368AB
MFLGTLGTGFQHQYLSRLSHPPHSRTVYLGISLSQRPGLFITVSDSSSVDTSIHMGGNEGGGRGLDRWGLFGMRSSVQKSPTDPGSDSSTSGGFSLQSYLGVQKSTTLDGIKTQINLVVEDPANFTSSKGEGTSVEEKKAAPQRLKHRDMNILTPSGF